jgi:hypothetical protein
MLMLTRSNSPFLTHQEDTIQHAEPRSQQPPSSTTSAFVRINHPTYYSLTSLPPPMLAHHTCVHPTHPRLDKIRVNTTRQANEPHCDPRCTLLLRYLCYERRDVSPIDAIPASLLARRLEHEFVCAAWSHHMFTQVSRKALAPSEAAKNRSSMPGRESMRHASWRAMLGHWAARELYLSFA